MRRPLRKERVPFLLRYRSPGDPLHRACVHPEEYLRRALDDGQCKRTPSRGAHAVDRGQLHLPVSRGQLPLAAHLACCDDRRRRSAEAHVRARANGSEAPEAPGGGGCWAADCPPQVGGILSGEPRLNPLMAGWNKVDSRGPFSHYVLICIQPCSKTHTIIAGLLARLH